jgi:hypothetical protein
MRMWAVFLCLRIQSSVAGSSGGGNEPLGSIKGGEFLD